MLSHLIIDTGLAVVAAAAAEAGKDDVEKVLSNKQNKAKRQKAKAHKHKKQQPDTPVADE